MSIRVSYIVNSVFSSRTYILSTEGSNDVWLVDCGDVDRLPDGVNVEGVLLTHAHFDHIYGLPKLLELFPEVQIYTNEWGRKALADARLNMSKYHETTVVVDCANVQVIGEGDKVCGFDVIETPGHNPSSICYYNSEMIFTGDSYIPGYNVVVNLPHCDIVQTETSLSRILQISEGKTIFPGHSV